MSWSIPIARIAGIRVFVHFTFLLLLGWIALLQGFQNGRWNWQRSLDGLVLFIFLAVIIVLHELGHALAARRYGIRTVDITLLPIGGIARLERMPEKPAQELVVALAGPAVNVVLAIGLFLGLSITGRSASDWMQALLSGASLPDRLLLINIGLAVFNMIPAFPMDGGRVLRALLALIMRYVDATQIAARIGQGLAVLFGLAGLFLFSNLFLVLIAIFIWFGAEAEAGMVRTRSLLSGIRVHDVMATSFQTLRPTETVRDAARHVIGGFQQDFPVVDNGNLAGILTRNDLLTALAQENPTEPVERFMRSKILTVRPADALEKALARLQQSDGRSVPVVDNGRIVGILTGDRISEFLMLREQMQQYDPRRPPEDDAPEPLRQRDSIV